MSLELLFAVLSRISEPAAFIFAISLLAAVGSWVGKNVNDHDEQTREGFSRVFPNFAKIAIISGIVAAIPPVEDLWKVRIAFIKLEMSKSENIDKGVEVIERIGKKLECKYLGCEEE